MCLVEFLPSITTRRTSQSEAIPWAHAFTVIFELVQLRVNCHHCVKLTRYRQTVIPPGPLRLHSTPQLVYSSRALMLTTRVAAARKLLHPCMSPALRTLSSAAPPRGGDRVASALAVGDRADRRVRRARGDGDGPRAGTPRTAPRS